MDTLKEQTNTALPQGALPQASRWQFLLIITSVLAMALNLILKRLPANGWETPHLGVFPGADLPLLLVMIGGGLPLLFQILRKLFHGDLGADLLAALALLSAAWLGQYLAATLIILMLASGQALEVYALRKASSVLLALAQRMPAQAHRKRAGHIEEIPLHEIRLGEAMVIYPHETSPVDGTVLEGHGSMDESYLTGEPYRVSKAPGSSILSGAINGDSVLLVRADKLPSDSRYAKIMTVMQEAEQKRPAMRRLGDQIGAIFAPLALLAAVGAWGVSGDPMRFLAVLVVATPCPLLIAIPITVISAISMAAKRGIIIKDPAVLERLPTCRTAIFDKTGTLTYGQPELTELLPAVGVSAEQILQNTASLERYSKHPLAGAILKAAEKDALFLPEATQVSEAPGQGLVGTVNEQLVQVTHRKGLARTHPNLLPLLPPPQPGLECVVLQNGNYAATFRFRDTPRQDGHSFITHLGPAHQFQKVMLVSGDRESEVRYLANLVGIHNTLASQSPEEKLALVRAETQKAPTLFMGDGINDAPALTAATVGLAFGQHTSVTAEAAGAVILESSLEKVDELMHLSLAMRDIALQSAVGGMLLSLVGIGFAASGWLTPVAGALLQEGIDILAILNALRLTWGNTMQTDLHPPSEE